MRQPFFSRAIPTYRVLPYSMMKLNEIKILGISNLARYHILAAVCVILNLVSYHVLAWVVGCSHV